MTFSVRAFLRKLYWFARTRGARDASGCLTADQLAGAPTVVANSQVGRSELMSLQAARPVCMKSHGRSCAASWPDARTGT